MPGVRGGDVNAASCVHHQDRAMLRMWRMRRRAHTPSGHCHEDGTLLRMRRMRGDADTGRPHQHGVCLRGDESHKHHTIHIWQLHLLGPKLRPEYAVVHA